MILSFAVEAEGNEIWQEISINLEWHGDKRLGSNSSEVIATKHRHSSDGTSYKN